MSDKEAAEIIQRMIEDGGLLDFTEDELTALKIAVAIIKAK